MSKDSTENNNDSQKNTLKVNLQGHLSQYFHDPHNSRTAKQTVCI